MTSLEAAVNEWVDYLRVEKGASSHTVSNYRRDALRYARDLEERGVRSLAEVSARDIEDYTMRLASGEVTGTPAAASSVARASAAIRGLHKYALTEGLVGVDPAAQLRAPRAGRHLPKALTVDEVGRLLDVAHANDSPIGLRDCALLELLYATGARVSEAVALSADDLDLDGDVPVVRLFGKGRKERIVPVGSFAVEALGAYRVRARPALAARVLLELSGRAPVAAERVDGDPARGAGRRPGGQGLAAHDATLICHPPPGGWGERARGPRAPRTCLSGDHADIYGGHGRRAARGFYTLAPPGAWHPRSARAMT